MTDVNRAALVNELRRQVQVADPKDDGFPWRQAFVNLATALEKDETWLARQDEDYERQVAECQEPGWHETHRYCPACPWTDEGPRIKANWRTLVGDEANRRLGQ